MKCPFCQKELKFNLEEKELQYFGKSVIISFYCENCGYKHSDTFAVDFKEPKAYYLKVKEEEDLIAKIVRGNFGIVEIKEIKTKLYPGYSSQAFITNVEGFLNKIEDVILGQKNFLKGKKLKKAEELLEKIEKMKRLEESFTVIVKDITGVSRIVGKNVKERKLRKNEIESLKKYLNLYVIDLSKQQ
ncbi:MAG: ZPR1 zinc finger domain-containing protein [Candidatus Aenigmatarchaeota archaeon]